MNAVRLNRRVREFIEAIDDSEWSRHCDDGLDFRAATRLQWEVSAELRRTEKTTRPTSWLSMAEAERAEIRPPRRRTPTGSLVLVRGEGAGVVTADEGEAA